MDIGHVLEYTVNQVAELSWDGVADGIGDIHRGGSSLDNPLENAVDVFQIGARGIPGGELHIFEVALSPGNHPPRGFQYLVAVFLELVELVSDATYSIQLPPGANGEASLDNIYAKPIQLPGNLHLVLSGEGPSRCLLPIPQSSIEDDDLIHVLLLKCSAVIV